MRHGDVIKGLVRTKSLRRWMQNSNQKLKNAATNSN